MLDENNFAPIQSTRVEDYSQAEKIFSNFGFDYRVVSLKNLSLTGDIQLKCNGDIFRMTSAGFDRMMHYLRLPHRFARRIPTDLLQNNFSRLCKEHPDMNVRLTLSKDVSTKGAQKVCGVLPTEQPVIDTLKLFQALREHDRPEPARVEISDEGLSIQTVETQEVPLKVGDVFKAGRSLWYSPAGIGKPVVKLLTWRLVCANGAVAPRAYGGFSPQYNARTTPDQFLTRLLKGYDALKFPWTPFTLKVSQANEELIKVRKAVNTYKQLERYIDVAEKINELFGWSEEAQVLCFTRAKEFATALKIARQEGNPLPVEPAVQPNYYYLFNSISQEAQEMQRLTIRLGLEQIAGRLLFGLEDLNPEETHG
jgi:hypothetical protein